jgi:serine/threonine protein kinase
MTNQVNEWVVGAVIAHGSQAEVFHVFSRTGSMQGAMKAFRGAEAKESYLREVLALSKQVAGIPVLLDRRDEEQWLVTEYFALGSVESALNVYRNNPVLAILAFSSLVKAVCSLHEAGLCHGDLSTPNILVRNYVTLVLGDFGYSQSHGPRAVFSPNRFVYSRELPDAASFDIFCLGQVLWRMVTGSRWTIKYWGVQWEQLFADDVRKSGVSDALIEICRPCLFGDHYGQRPTARQLHELVLRTYLLLGASDRSERCDVLLRGDAR